MKESEYKDADIAYLMEKNNELELENEKLKKTLLDNGIQDNKISLLSDVEVICVLEIKKLKVLSEKGLLNNNEVKALDILHKNLLQARGLYKNETKDSKKSGPKEVADLLKIVGNS